MRVLIWLTVVNAVIYGVVAFVAWNSAWPLGAGDWDEEARLGVAMLYVLANGAAVAFSTIE